MKKLSMCVLAAVLVLAFGGCSPKEEPVPTFVNIENNQEFLEAGVVTGTVNVTYTYNEDGLAIYSEHHQDGSLLSITTWEYDGFGDPIEITTEGNNTVEILEYKYTLDNDGRILRQDMYQNGRLTSVDEFTYDRRGNELTHEYLNEFEWYTKFFLLLRNSTGSRSVVAHNGIYCGNADFFYDEWNEREKLGTIVLLKDKYRPTVDMSRDKIRQIPLEVTCDLEILRKQLESQGFEFEGSQKNLDEAHYPYISTREYVNLLKHRPDFIDRLRFSTNRGALSAVTIDEMVQKGETIKFLGCPKLNNHGYSSRNLYLYDYLCAAYLRSRYILRVDFSQYDPTIFIESRANDMQEKVTDYFSPTFFLSTKKEITYLTTKSTSWRKTCNDSHRLARFIIDNAEQLRSKVPGLFFEILRSLAEDDAKDVISVINDLLQRLRSLPDIGIVIPTDLQLCKDDFSDY